MICKEAIDHYLVLDQGEPIPPELQEHIDNCPHCRRLVHQMEAAFSSCRDSVEKIPCPDVAESVLKAIAEAERLTAPLPFRSTSPGNWIVPGIFLFLGILGLPFSTVLVTLVNHTGRSLEIWVPLVLGTTFTLYAALFAGSNLDWLRKKFIH
ncbi:MAG: hypothetical protein KA771_06860 [Spirochaetales bacterium]|nr:hypothetical protein [Spirochaetales bacterium]